MTPLSASRGPDLVYCRVRTKTLAFGVLFLPVFGFVSCVTLAILLHYKETTATHCRVANYLPSTSAAIGGNAPEIYIWRICIALHCAPRFLAPVWYYHIHTSVQAARFYLYKMLVILACCLHTFENFMLVGLTNISSLENHGLHVKLFMLFVVSSEIYMAMTCSLFKWGRGGGVNPKEQKSYKWKLVSFGVSVGSLLMAAYFFYRHNKYCEAGVYTLFSLMEYLVIFSNIVFHGTIVFDADSIVTEIAAGESTHSKNM